MQKYSRIALFPRETGFLEERGGATKLHGRRIVAVLGLFLVVQCLQQPEARAATVDLSLSGVVNGSSTTSKVPLGSFLSMTFTYDTDTPLYAQHSTIGGGNVATYINAITGFSTTVIAPDGLTVLYTGTATGGPFGYIRTTNDNHTAAAGTYDVFQATIASFASDYNPAGAAGSNPLPNTDIAYFDAQGAYNHFRSAEIRLPLLSTALADISIPSSFDFADVDTGNPSTSFTFNLQYTYLGPDGSGAPVNIGPINIGANLTSLTLTANSVSAVPLPAALPLLASGLGGFGLLGWRRKRKATAHRSLIEGAHFLDFGEAAGWRPFCWRRLAWPRCVAPAPEACDTGGMASDKKIQAEGSAAPPATGWGVLIALVLVAAIFLFTGFESHWL